MIIDHGGDVNLIDEHGNNALWTATFNARGNYDIVKMFLSASGNHEHKNNHGRSAYDSARQINDQVLLKMFQGTSP